MGNQYENTFTQKLDSFQKKYTKISRINIIKQVLNNKIINISKRNRLSEQETKITPYDSSQKS